MPLLSHLINGKERKPVRKKAQELGGRGRGGGRANGLRLSVDCGGQGPHIPAVPQIQASTVGGGRTESELTRWARTPAPWSGA